MRRHLSKVVGIGPIPQKLAEQYAELMVDEVGKIIWKKKPGRSYPRVSKQSINKWQLCKYKKIKEFYEGKSLT